MKKENFKKYRFYRKSINEVAIRIEIIITIPAIRTERLKWKKLKNPNPKQIMELIKNN